VALRLKQGTDETIKRYLASKLKETRDTLDLKSQSYQSLEDKLLATQDTLLKSQASNEQLMQDLAQLREGHRRLVESLRLEEQKHLNELKERMLLEQAEGQARAEAEKREIQGRYEREARGMMEKVESHIANTQKAKEEGK
jgi:hypothetical protein